AIVTDPIPGRGACATDWAQVSGAPVTVRDAATASPRFVARRAGSFRFRAVATCGGAASLPALVDVAVTNVAPLAHGGGLLTLPAGGRATLTIYDVAGRLVTTLVDRDLPAGRHSATWHGTDEQGRRVATGVYFYQLRSGGTSLTRSMVLLK
ncbi:MAG TPA: FlgD immunoglobulin-like domain containing protein, partial [Gemmatimonadaceae bacterium]|nr:FlgD immunoglobulin-like domain containing protein [Gemmatimonadaceae bacterium]